MGDVEKDVPPEILSSLAAQQTSIKIYVESGLPSDAGRLAIDIYLSEVFDAVINTNNLRVLQHFIDFGLGAVVKRQRIEAMASGLRPSFDEFASSGDIAQNAYQSLNPSVSEIERLLEEGDYRTASTNASRFVKDLQSYRDNGVSRTAVDALTAISLILQSSTERVIIAESHVNQLPGMVNSSFYVTWNADLADNDVQRFDVFVSEDSGEFVKWKSETSDFSGTFNGKPGRAYGFYSIGRTLEGDVESTPSIPDTFTTVNSKAWQNVFNTLDVNNDKFVSPIDVLIVINELNRRSGVGDGRLPPTNSNVGSFYDVDGDEFVTPLDALNIINELNRRSGSGGEGERSITGGRMSADLFVNDFTTIDRAFADGFDPLRRRRRSGVFVR